ncbi:MAG: hypothetical protein OHK0029_25820 [Armatimonadaceae bacterium]
MNIRNLMQKMAAAEQSFAETPFLAPCVRGGTVRVRIGGVVQTFRVSPADFEGWGIFKAQEAGAGRVAQCIEEAELPLIGEFLKRFPLLRLRLARVLSGATWLAYPANEADMAQRFGEARPVAVHLVTEGTAFEQVTARCVGGAWWFEEIDRRADPEPLEKLRDALRAVVEPAELAFGGMTPEMRTVYDLAAQSEERFARVRQQRINEAERQRQAERRAQVRRAEQQFREEHGYSWYDEAHWDERQEWEREAMVAEPPEPQAGRGRRPQRRNRRNAPENRHPDDHRLREALAVGGGELRDYTDRGEYYLVEWATQDGVRHTSAIAKADLTVISSGICLSGRDRDFDLQSLVGVMERQWE